MINFDKTRATATVHPFSIGWKLYEAILISHDILGMPFFRHTHMRLTNMQVDRENGIIHRLLIYLANPSHIGTTNRPTNLVSRIYIQITRNHYTALFQPILGD